MKITKTERSNRSILIGCECPHCDSEGVLLSEEEYNDYGECLSCGRVVYIKALACEPLENPLWGYENLLDWAREGSIDQSISQVLTLNGAEGMIAGLYLYNKMSPEERKAFESHLQKHNRA